MLAIMAFGQIGYYLKLNFAQEERKEFIKTLLHQNIPDEVLTVIDFTNNKQKIYWEEIGKEFFYKGEMYDIVKLKNVSGKIIFFCLNDKKEKELIEKYYSITKNNPSKDKKAKTFEPDFNLFIFQQNKIVVYQLYNSVKQYGLSVSTLAAGFTNQLLQPPTFC